MELVPQLLKSYGAGSMPVCYWPKVMELVPYRYGTKVTEQVPPIELSHRNRPISIWGTVSQSFVTV